MNVLFISNDPSIFDPESPARARMRAYAHEIGTLHILSRGKSGKGSNEIIREEVPEGGTLVLYPAGISIMSAKNPFMLLKLIQRARKIIQEEKIELVSAQDPFEYGWVAMQAAKGTNARLHIQAHTDPFSQWFTRVKIIHSSQVRMPLINKVRQWLADQVLPHADGIRTVSKRVQESLIDRYGSKIPYPSMIPIAVSAQVPPPLSLPEHPFTFALITVGRLEPEKRVEDSLVALSKIHTRYPEAGLIILGDGSERKKLEQYAKQLNLGSSVLFLGHTPDAWRMMQSAQAYIQSSGYEGYSRTLLEAALARVPIVTTDVGIVGEVFRGYEDVFAAPPGDPTELAVHIVSLIEDSAVGKQLVANAEKAARAHLASVHTSPADIAQDLRNTLTKQ
jgi:glycosyltransferase involved in cell wall biosynthesis